MRGQKQQDGTPSVEKRSRRICTAKKPGVGKRRRYVQTKKAEKEEVILSGTGQHKEP